MRQLLDEAVEAIMERRDAPLPPVDPRLEAILALAGELRDLPRPAFRARLAAALRAATIQGEPPPNHGRPLLTPDDIDARLEEIRHAAKLATYDVGDALDDLPEMAMRFFTSLNECTVGVSRASAQAPLWERHPAGDEMLYVVDGGLDVTTLTPDGPVHTRVPAGSLFICPQGLWHWPRPDPFVSILFATPGEGIEHSNAEDPRGGSGRPAREEPAAPAPPGFAAHDLRAAVDSVRPLIISEATTEADAAAAVRHLAWMGRCNFGVMSFRGQTPWERHPGGDELLHAIDGEVEVTVLTDDGPVRTTIGAGTVFVCPQGLWHRQLSRRSVSILYGTPTETTEISFAEDPRSEA